MSWMDGADFIASGAKPKAERTWVYLKRHSLTLYEKQLAKVDANFAKAEASSPTDWARRTASGDFVVSWKVGNKPVNFKARDGKRWSLVRVKTAEEAKTMLGKIKAAIEAGEHDREIEDIWREVEKAKKEKKATKAK